MKKIYTLLFLFFLSISFANAQWVTIPDANFAAFLQQNYPQCMNGNQMDTTCSGIVNGIIINCSNKNISDLTGIEYFDSLEELICNNNQLTFLPPLPAQLTYLRCDNNQLISLPLLPTLLEKLLCSFNQITSLPTLPNSIEILDCSNNQLISLPPLPTSLISLACHKNQLTSLPLLPASLTYLGCEYNQLTSLPALPLSLSSLDCSINQITSLPTLPSSLIELYCSTNQLTTLPFLPASLTTLNCIGNQIASLPILPASLTYLASNSNQLTSLPILPTSLTTLACSHNQLTSLPSLPPSLTVLNCINNQITILPNLPNSLRYLFCYNNQLSSLPTLPDTLDELFIHNNSNLICLPKLKNIKNKFIYYNTAIQCLPNYPNMFGPNVIVSPTFSSIPLCDLFNNPNNCDIYWNISGKVFSDVNNDCINDNNEQKLNNLKLQLFQNGNLIQQVYSGSEGLYSFDTDTGTFTYTVDTADLPVMVTCPSSGFHNSVLTPLDSMDYNMDFAMQCKPGFDVGVKNIVRTSGQFFPANFATIKIGAGDMASFYGLTCAAGVSGSVIVNFTGPISYISEVPGSLVPSVVGNTLTYTISDFGLVNFNSDFRFIVQTDTTAQAGNAACFTVSVTPTTGDNNVTNNSLQHCFTVVNSFDPNAKEVYPEGGIPINQDWLTYTIHFQNTGNAPAQNIYILDALDQNLIPETFTLLSYSHEPLTQLFENVVKFNFPNINLPDSTNDEPNSHGFVQYKVKMVQGLPVGTLISNTSYNFFDFNPPVATNTVSNMVDITSVLNINEKIHLSVYPNPATDEINVSFILNSPKEIKIELYNSLGQIVKTISKRKLADENNLITFSVNDLSKGIYHLKFSAGDEVVVKRVAKM